MARSIHSAAVQHALESRGMKTSLYLDPMAAAALEILREQADEENVTASRVIRDLLMAAAGVVEIPAHPHFTRVYGWTCEICK